MKLDKETLLKQRFWILLGLFVPIVIVALIMLMTGVAGAVGGKRAEIETNKGLMDKINSPKNKTWVAEIQPRKARALEKSAEVCNFAYESQADLLYWPQEMQDKFGNLEFGKNLAEEETNTCLAYARKDVYETQVKDLLRLVDPLGRSPEEIKSQGQDQVVQFDGGWEKVLRYVKDFGEVVTLEDVWLAQDDIWFQRGLLYTIGEANYSVALFRNKDKEEIGRHEGLLKEKQSKLADLQKKEEAARGSGNDPALADLQKQIKEEENKLRQLKEAGPKVDKSKGEIDRQTFTNANWKLELALAPDASQKNKLFLKAKLTNITNRRLSLGIQWRVQVKEGGEPEWLYADGEPLMPGESWEWKDPVNGPDAKELLEVYQVFNWRTVPIKRINKIELGYFSQKSVVDEKLPLVKFAKLEVKEGGGSAAASGRQDPKAAQPASDTNTSRNGLKRNRYTVVNDQVRRMPVGLVLVVDPAHIPDVLTAFANSKLRIQIMQVQWQHVPGLNLKPKKEEEPKASPAAPVPAVGRERNLPDRRVVPRPGVIPGRGIPPGLRLPPQRTPTRVKQPEDEREENLVELAIYGVATIYERPKEKEAPQKR